MTKRIVIIGNSAAGLSGLESFRKVDPDSTVTIIAREDRRPYSKVLLPYYLRGTTPYDNLFIRPDDYYSNLNAACIQSEVVDLSPAEKLVRLGNGDTVPYDKLLIATGASPVHPPVPGLEGDGICNLWTLKDAGRLDDHFKTAKRIVVMGSGFVSLQAACAALTRGLDVTVIELMDRIMPRSLDDAGAALLSKHLKKEGGKLKVKTLTRKVTRLEDGSYRMEFDDGTSLDTDCILVGVGVKPNIDFLKNSSVQIDQGILVNRQMQTSEPDIYAAGDVAQVPSWRGETSVVHALWPTAIETGAVAGRSMAMQNTAYQGSLNMNVTQMFGITVASIGDISDSEEAESWLDTNLDDDQYLKIVLKNNVPVGATCVGSAKLVSTLGILRPLIRERIEIEGSPELLRSIMAKNFSRYHQAFSPSRTETPERTDRPQG